MKEIIQKREEEFEKAWHGQLHTEESGWDEDHDNFLVFTSSFQKETVKQVLEAIVVQTAIDKIFYVEREEEELKAIHLGQYIHRNQSEDRDVNMKDGYVIAKQDTINNIKKQIEQL